MTRGIARNAAAISATAVLAVLGLTGCSASAPSAERTSASPPGAQAPSAVEGATTPPVSAAPTTATCDLLARIDWQQDGAAWRQVAIGSAVDGGPRPGAMGTAEVDASGRVVGYEVAAGDAPVVIQDRFCIDGVSVLHFNGYGVTGDGKDIAPGDHLYLAPDPAFVNPFL